MDSLMDDCSPYSRVSPFRDLRIKGYLLLPEAYRSLSRLSSALSAKASTLRSSSLNLHIQHSVAGVRPGFFTSSWASSSRTLPTTSCDHLPMISSDVLNILRIVVFCMRFSRYTSFIWLMFYQPYKTENFFCLICLVKPVILFYNPAATCSPMPSPA